MLNVNQTLLKIPYVKCEPINERYSYSEVTIKHIFISTLYTLKIIIPFFLF